MTRARRRVNGKRSVFVLLPDEALHHALDFVGVNGYGWFGTARVVGMVGIDIANALHVLGFVRISWHFPMAELLTST